MSLVLIRLFNRRPTTSSATKNPISLSHFRHLCGSQFSASPVSPGPFYSDFSFRILGPQWSSLFLQRLGLSDIWTLYLPSPMKFEQDVETVIRILQPGPVGIVEHKFTVEEIHEANATVRKAVENWRRRAKSEARNSVLKNYVDM